MLYIKREQASQLTVGQSQQTEHKDGDDGEELHVDSGFVDFFRFGC